MKQNIKLKSNEINDFYEFVANFKGMKPANRTYLELYQEKKRGDLTKWTKNK